MTDYQTRQKQQNRIVGVFVFLAFLAFVWMIVKFRNLPLFASQLRSYNVVIWFDETPGVQVDTPVYYCGRQIGRVIDISWPIRVEGVGGVSHRVRVTAAIDKRHGDIPDNVEFVIIKRGLGSSFIEIRRTEEKASGFLQAGAQCVGSVSTASEFFPPQVQKKLEDLVDSITILAKNTNLIIGDKQNQANIQQILANLNQASVQLTETLKSFQQFSEVGVEKLDQLVYRLDSTFSELQRLLTALNEGQGSAGKFITDGRLYENLLDSSKQLELALDQIKRWAVDAREKGIRIKW